MLQHIDVSFTKIKTQIPIMLKMHLVIALYTLFVLLYNYNIKIPYQFCRMYIYVYICIKYF